MNITLVADVFGENNNGTSATASRLVENMKKRGHNVKVVSPFHSEDNNFYTVSSRSFGIFNDYVEKINGVTLGKPERITIWEAIKDADIVHFLLPFQMSKCGIKLCLENNIPFTTAFHCQPENITSHIFLQKAKLINDFIYKYFKTTFYRKALYVHCPSQFIADKLVKNHYHTTNFVISNGVRDEFVPTKSTKPSELKDKFCILLSGRYSIEKRQDVLINAVNKSKYRDKIQLILAGNGPQKNYYEKLGKKLPNPPIFTFLNTSDLIKVINYCDLYVHASDVEIEGIGCMEAISCGLVPVLSNSSNAALSQFALDERNLFNHGNYNNLAQKIDYWIEHDKEKQIMSQQYAKFMEQYKIEKCMDKMEEMFKFVISEHKKYNDKSINKNN